ALRSERFDLVHLHEPFTPTICVATLAFAECPAVATWHAAGDLAWMRAAMPVWGFLIDRLETRIAVSRLAAESAERWLGGGFEIVPNEERDAELAASKLFVSPALGGESFGMVLVEAFATATPIVASNIPGFADVATKEAALLVKPGDERALADAICELLADEDRR